jgi:hypothetical protein
MGEARSLLVLLSGMLWPSANIRQKKGIPWTNALAYLIATIRNEGKKTILTPRVVLIFFTTFQWAQ